MFLPPFDIDVPLQPLRIPAGWFVNNNDGLYEIDPRPEAIPEDKHSWFFREDMLQLKHAHFNRLLDVGWYPEGDLKNGSYMLVVYEDDFHGRLIYELRTRNRQELVAEIDRLLLGVVEGTV